MELSREALSQLAKDVKELSQHAIDGVKVRLEVYRHPRARAKVLSAAGCRRQRDVCNRRATANLLQMQVFLNDDNLTDIQAEYEGPGGTGTGRWSQDLFASGIGCVSVGSKMCPFTRSLSFLSRSSVLPAAGTPFESGLFRMRLAIGPEFPNSAPKGALGGVLFRVRF
jgi:hypothetical protein